MKSPPHSPVTLTQIQHTSLEECWPTAENSITVMFSSSEVTNSPGFDVVCFKLRPTYSASLCLQKGGEG